MSHLTDIGFAFSGPDEFLGFVEQVSNLEDNASFAATDGFYNLWSPGAAIELWINADRRLRLSGCALHFAGDGRLQMHVTQTYPVLDTVMRGTAYGWVSPEDESNPYTGLTPLAVAVPNFNCISELVLRHPMVTLQVTGFVEGFLECYAPNSEFAPEKCLTPPWFGNPNLDPEPNAEVAGTVVTAKLVTNALTGNQFWHVLLDTVGGTIDLVVDQESVMDGPPSQGQRARAKCWLSAHVVSEMPRVAVLPKPESTFRARREARRRPRSED